MDYNEGKGTVFLHDESPPVTEVSISFGNTNSTIPPGYAAGDATSNP